MKDLHVSYGDKGVEVFHLLILRNKKEESHSGELIKEENLWSKPKDFGRTCRFGLGQDMPAAQNMPEHKAPHPICHSCSSSCLSLFLKSSEPSGGHCSVVKQEAGHAI